MIPTLSLLDTASATARHAGHVHAVAADNIARADIPGATARAATSFAEAVGTLRDGGALSPRDTNAAISLDREMTTMASNAGRHDAATILFGKALDMLRLAGSTPR